jgi:hypothetical protein
MEHKCFTEIGLDSGTGETKVLLFKHTDGNVETKELVKVGSLAGLFSAETIPNEDRVHQIDNFVKIVQEIVAQHQPARCFAGTTAWYRAAPPLEKNALNSFFATRLPGFKLINLTGEEEARFEADAVEYAAQKSDIGKPDMQIAAGGGSMQLVQGQSIFTIKQGFRHGQGELMSGEEETRVVHDRLVKRVRAELSSFKASKSNFMIKSGMKVIGISAAYYAAKGAKIDCSGSVKASHVLTTFKERKHTLMNEVETSRGVPKKIAQEIANLVIFSEVFETLVHPDALIFFKRDWVLDGVPFITTWSAGYVLSDKVHAENQLCAGSSGGHPPREGKKGLKRWDKEKAVPLWGVGRLGSCWARWGDPWRFYALLKKGNSRSTEATAEGGDMFHTLSPET